VGLPRHHHAWPGQVRASLTLRRRLPGEVHERGGSGVGSPPRGRRPALPLELPDRRPGNGELTTPWRRSSGGSAETCCGGWLFSVHRDDLHPVRALAGGSLL
jgi:hypothetical protein